MLTIILDSLRFESSATHPVSEIDDEIRKQTSAQGSAVKEQGFKPVTVDNSLSRDNLARSAQVE